MECIEKLVSIVIPCYRSEQTVKSVIEEISSVFGKQTEYDYEIITVIDASPDNVYSVLESLSKTENRLKVVDLAVNSGKHNAILAGFAYVKGSMVITIDDDGQCPFNRVWDLLAPLNEGFDMAVAKYKKKKESFIKRLGSRFNSKFSESCLNKPRDLVFSNFVARKRFVVEAMKNYHMPYTYLEGLTLKTTQRIAMVDMEERERAGGKSTYTFVKSLRLMMNGYTAYSTKPLHIATRFGAFLAFFGALFAVSSVVLNLVKDDFLLQFHFLCALLCFLTGVILLAMGVVGEYIGRVFIAQNCANQYVVRRTINLE